MGRCGWGRGNGKPGKVGRWPEGWPLDELIALNVRLYEATEMEDDFAP